MVFKRQAFEMSLHLLNYISVLELCDERQRLNEFRDAGIDSNQVRNLQVHQSSFRIEAILNFIVIGTRT